MINVLKFKYLSAPLYLEKTLKFSLSNLQPLNKIEHQDFTIYKGISFINKIRSILVLKFAFLLVYCKVYQKLISLLPTGITNVASSGN
jgi:hypothetical protein